jgi:hypothetical protein
MDAVLFDLLLEKLNRLVNEASKIRNGKDAILEKWLDNQEVCEILVSAAVHCKNCMIPAR